MENVLEVKDIVTRFGADVVHDGVSFTVARGEVAALIGGTGKSVLLKEMIGLLRPTSGSVRLLGADVWQSDEEQMNGLRRRFGMLFQDGALFSSLTVAENIAVPFREHTDLSDEVIAPLVGFKLSLVGLAPDTGKKTPAQLSGGMRKRLALAQTLILSPDILLMDEPFSARSARDPSTAWCARSATASASRCSWSPTISTRCCRSSTARSRSPKARSSPTARSTRC